MHKETPNGVWFPFRSTLTGDLCFCVILFKGNAKTKPRRKRERQPAQVYFLDASEAPHLAQKSGKDASVCGDCKHRPHNNGMCYVRTGQGPLIVYRQVMQGRYPQVTLEEARQLLTETYVRLGAYGDPAALPRDALRYIVGEASRVIGYTHQWASRPDLADLCMASVDTQAEYHAAKLAGWRTFRVLADTKAKKPSEIACPASERDDTGCTDCLLCDGAGKAKDIAILAHGATATKARLKVLQ